MSVDKCGPGVVWTRESRVCTKSKSSKFFELHCQLFISSNICWRPHFSLEREHLWIQISKKVRRGGGGRGFWKLLMYNKVVLPSKILEYYLFSRLPSLIKYLSNILSAEPSNYIWELLSAKIFDLKFLHLGCCNFYQSMNELNRGWFRLDFNDTLKGWF